MAAAEKMLLEAPKPKGYLPIDGIAAYDKAVQGLGRTHRTNQKSAPHYKLVATNIPAHKRFLSSIARRLDQLGALTKGQRDTANQGLFSEKDNLESKYAQAAVRHLLDDAKNGGIAGLDFMDFLRQMGLENIVDPKTNGIAEDKYPPMSQFLNRMLSLKLGTQEQVFEPQIGANAFVEGVFVEDHAVFSGRRIIARTAHLFAASESQVDSK